MEGSMVDLGHVDLANLELYFLDSFPSLVPG